MNRFCAPYGPWDEFVLIFQSWVTEALLSVLRQPAPGVTSRDAGVAQAQCIGRRCDFLPLGELCGVSWIRIPLRWANERGRALALHALDALLQFFKERAFQRREKQRLALQPVQRCPDRLASVPPPSRQAKAAQRANHTSEHVSPALLEL